MRSAQCHPAPRPSPRLRNIGNNSCPDINRRVHAVWDVKGMIMCKLAFARLWLSDRHHPLSGTTMDIFGAIGKAFNVTAKYTHKFDTGKFFHASYVHGAVHQDSPIAGWLQQR